ncbi:MarR family transcriptional regulator [Cohnella thermotolerans]|jgi:DNA-binding MarR family transcriptional regulator|uniref:MarR family transcriptional regulator n=1 Tax=Cohnella thermotolerans TaxID=329858 RepID=UPI0003FA64CC|nr:MarR family transcriptional regulator [Cohnella thermotolerans]
MDEQTLKQAIERYSAAMFTVNRRFNAIVRELMPEELTVDQYYILSSIRSQGQCTSSELADIFCVGKSSITAIIARLFDKRWIRRIPDEKDRRVIYLSLTEEGEKLAAEIDLKIEGLMGNYLNRFTDEEAQRFLETYEKLANVLLET